MPTEITLEIVAFFAGPLLFVLAADYIRDKLRKSKQVTE